jgi:hypothetical protein
MCSLPAAVCAVAHVFPPPSKEGGGTFNALGVCTSALPPRITKVIGAYLHRAGWPDNPILYLIRAGQSAFSTVPAPSLSHVFG